MSLVPNTLNTEVLIQALTEYLDAQREHDREYEAYKGHSWGYHGRWLIKAMEVKAELFQKTLEEYINRRVDERLNKFHTESVKG